MYLVTAILASHLGFITAPTFKPEAWQLSGTAVLRGKPAEFKLIFDTAGRFRWDVMGPTPESNGFNGHSGWIVAGSGLPHPVILEQTDSTQLEAMVFGSLNVSLRTTGRPLHFTLRSMDGIMPGTVYDADGHCSLKFWTSSGDEQWDYSNYKSFGGQRFPTKVVSHVGSQVEHYELVSAHRVNDDAAIFEEPKPQLSGTSFDQSWGQSVPMKIVGASLFIHPRVNGEDVGWFFFDTGADVMCIDPTVAKKLKLDPLGSQVTAGIAATTETPIYGGKEFRLGPIGFQPVQYYGLDLQPYSKALGLPLAGICGFDYISRGVFEINLKSKTVNIYKPGEFKLPIGASWFPIQFDGNVPCVKCSYEGGHSGIFNLDTGSSAGVQIFTTEAQKNHLLDRATQGSVAYGAGGSGAERTGNLDWLELGGHHIEKPVAAFELTKTGVFASPYLAGNIGVQVLGRYRIVLDYPNRRMALISYRKD